MKNKPSKKSRIIVCNFKKYKKYFQKFLDNNIFQSKMVSLIYGVSKNGREGLGYMNEPLFETHEQRVRSYYLKGGHNKRISPMLKTWKDE